MSGWYLKTFFLIASAAGSVHIMSKYRLPLWSLIVAASGSFRESVLKGNMLAGCKPLPVLASTLTAGRRGRSHHPPMSQKAAAVPGAPVVHHLGRWS